MPGNGHDICECGHVLDEHGGDSEHPNATACTIEGCDCIDFEEVEEEE